MSRWTYKLGKAQRKVEMAGTASVRARTLRRLWRQVTASIAICGYIRGTDLGAGCIARLPC